MARLVRITALALSCAVAIGCSSTSTAPGRSDGPAEAKEETSPALPAGTEDGDDGEEPQAPAGPAPLTASPSCGEPGKRVLLRLGWTNDGRVPSCVRIEDFSVVFAPAQPAWVSMAGPTDDGYCALDVEIPEGAVSGPVTVTIGRDVFESTADFALPCR